jgi:hypothetical protein
MPQEDVLAVRAYFNTVTPVRNKAVQTGFLSRLTAL